MFFQRRFVHAFVFVLATVGIDCSKAEETSPPFALEHPGILSVVKEMAHGFPGTGTTELKLVSLYPGPDGNFVTENVVTAVPPSLQIEDVVLVLRLIPKQETGYTGTPTVALIPLLEYGDLRSPLVKLRCQVVNDDPNLREEFEEGKPSDDFWKK